MAIIADIHVHVRPAHDAGRLLAGAARRLRGLAAAAGHPDATPVLCLTECAGARVFEQWLSNELPAGWTRREVSADGLALSMTGPDTPSLWIVAGRQCATSERMEVHALGCRAALSDGMTAEQTIEAALSAGARPVMAWAVGKWMFRREERLNALMDRFSASQLALADSSMRPIGWPTPAQFRRASREGRPILAGSDPLPPKGEEEVCGTFATLIPNATPDPARPAAGIVEALCSSSQQITVGRRNCPMRFVHRMLRFHLCRAPE